MSTIRIDDFSPGLMTGIGDNVLPPGAARYIRNFYVHKKGKLKTVTGPVLVFSAKVNDPTVAPVLSVQADAGSTLPAGTYYAGYADANENGQTILSPVVSIAVAAGQDLVVTVPAYPVNVNARHIYIGSSLSSLFDEATINSPTLAYVRSTSLSSVTPPRNTNEINVATVRQAFRWLNIATGERYLFAVIGKGVYIWQGLIKNGATIVNKYTGLADDLKDPDNTPSFATWRGLAFISSRQDRILKSDGSVVQTITAVAGSDPGKTYLTEVPMGVGMEIAWERLWIADGSTVRYSEPGYYDIWDANGNFKVRKDDGYKITALKKYSGDLFIFKEQSMDALVGGAPPDGGFKKEVHPSIGCIATNSLVITESFMIWLSHEGVMRMGPDGIKSLSEPVQTWFSDAYMQAARDLEVWPDTASNDEFLAFDETTVIGEESISAAWAIQMLLGDPNPFGSAAEYATAQYKDGVYYLSVPTGQDPDQVRVFAFYVGGSNQPPAWTILENTGGNCLFKLIPPIDSSSILAGKQSCPEITSLDSGGALALSAQWTSGDLDHPDIRGLVKEFRRIKVSVIVDATTATQFTIGYSINPEKASSDPKTGSIVFSPDLTKFGLQVLEKSFPMTAIGRSIKITPEVSGSLEISSIEIYCETRRLR